MNKQVLLREATRADLPLMLSWRSNPLVFSGFYQQQAPLLWDEHSEWWDGRNKDWRCFIIVLNEGCSLRDIGVVNIGQLEYWEFEVGVYIGETTLWGKGVGKEAVKLALQYGKSYGKQYCRTTILDNNERSKRLFLGLGFKRIGVARLGESLYRKEI